LKSGQIVVVDVENPDTPEAAFTFRGEPKPAMVPETVPVLEEAAPATGTEGTGPASE
jgi:ATP-dependent Clp protease ATP-binding subunit ClpC